MHQTTAQLRLRAESGCARQQARGRNLAVDNGEQLVPRRRQGERADVAARQQPRAVGLGRRLATFPVELESQFLPEVPAVGRPTLAAC